MATVLRFLRGTTAQNDAYTGYIGEITIDTEKREIRVHDGSTPGGITKKLAPLANQLYPEGYVYTILQGNADQKDPAQLGLGTVGGSGDHWQLETLETADFGGGFLLFYTRTSTQFTEGDLANWDPA